MAGGKAVNGRYRGFHGLGPRIDMGLQDQINGLRQRERMVGPRTSMVVGQGTKG